MATISQDEVKMNLSELEEKLKIQTNIKMPDQNLPKIWQNFFLKFEYLDLIKVKNWKEVHCLGYFDRLYNKHYGRKFAYSLTGQPSKCSEIVFIRKIMANLDAHDSEIVKEYFDWVFEEKIIPLKKNLRTLSYLMSNGLINEFLESRQKKTIKSRIQKSTTLSFELQQLAQTYNVPAETYGDLAFAKLAYEMNSVGKENYGLFFDMAENKLGFDQSILETLE